jgi:hypothetical protein
MILLYIVGVLVALWLLLTAGLWTWFFFSGHKDDPSGDLGLAVLSIPFIPIVAAWHACVGLVVWVGSKLHRLLEVVGL